MGDHFRQGGPSMAAIDDPAGPSMATKSAMDGLAGPVVAGDHLIVYYSPGAAEEFMICHFIAHFNESIYVHIFLRAFFYVS